MQKPVSQERYNEEWIESAWGVDGSDDLFQNKAIQPRPRVARALDLCNLKKGDKVLDIACGRGEVPAILAENGITAVGIDYSYAVLNLAKKVKERRTEFNQACMDMHLLQTDACFLPFADESFDRITMLDIVEHLTPSQLYQMLMEVKRVLRNDGYAVIHTLPNRWVYDIGYKYIQLFFRNLPIEPRSEIEKQVHINEQDIISLAKVFDQCDFQYALWLEQLIPAQAKWQRSRGEMKDNRSKLYPLLSGKIGILVKILCLTPAKLVLSNDIYAVLAKSHDYTFPIDPPISMTEKLVCSISRMIRNGY